MGIVGVQIPPPAPMASIIVNSDQALFMQVTETSAEGLKREFRFASRPASSRKSHRPARRNRPDDAVPRLPSGQGPDADPAPAFRHFGARGGPGEHRAGQFGRGDSRAQLRPALPPRYDLVSSGEGADLEYKMSLGGVAGHPGAGFADLDIERLVVEVPDEDIDRALERFAEQQRKSETVERRPRAAISSSPISRGMSATRRSPAAAARIDRSCSAPAGSFPASRSS